MQTNIENYTISFMGLYEEDKVYISHLFTDHQFELEDELNYLVIVFLKSKWQFEEGLDLVDLESGKETKCVM